MACRSLFRLRPACHSGGGACPSATPTSFLSRARKGSLIFLDHLASFGIFRTMDDVRVALFLRSADF